VERSSWDEPQDLGIVITPPDNYRVGEDLQLRVRVSNDVYAETDWVGLFEKGTDDGSYGNRWYNFNIERRQAGLIPW
jgi:hypothetical protein